MVTNDADTESVEEEVVEGPSSSNRDPYWVPGRLADVLSLIQFLALHKWAHRSEGGLLDGLGKPKSGASWTEVASQHREFFRLTSERKIERGANIRISLIARHVLEKNEENRRPTMESGFVDSLLRTAVELHDRALARHWWARYGAAISGIVGTVIGAIVGMLANG